VEIQVDAGHACYLEVLDGTHAGHRIEIATMNAGTAVLALSSPLSTLKELPQDLSGARVIVRPHVTLAQVFAPDVFQAGAVPAAADQVLFYENGGWHTHWLNGSRQWVSANDTTLASQNAKIIPPGIGLMVKTAGNAKAATLTGHVRMNPWRRPLSKGQNFLALPWPVDATPQSLGLTADGGFTAATSTPQADELHISKADAAAGTITDDAFWLIKRAPTPYWTAKNSSSLQNVSTTLRLPAHRAFFLKAQPATAVKGG
jgi:hypothetical protein